jgi:hypothetical protein
MPKLKEYSWSGHSVLMGKVGRDWQDTESILSFSKLGRLSWGPWPPGFPGQKEPIGIWFGPEAVPPR